MNKFLLLAALILTVSGCVNYIPPTDNSIKEHIVQSSYDDTFDKAANWFKNNNIHLQGMDRSSGLIAGTYIPKDGVKYLDCGYFTGFTGARGIFFDDAQININAILEKSGLDTKVRFNILGDAVLYRGTPDSKWHTVGKMNTSCVSTGALERSFFEAIQ